MDDEGQRVTNQSSAPRDIRSVIPVHALVYEPEAATRDTISQWLTAEHFRVEAFPDRDAAVERARQSPFDLALVDLNTLAPNDLALISDLCKTSPHIRVVAATSLAEPKRVISAVRAGMRDLLEKPVKREELLESFTRQLEALGLYVRSENAFNRRMGARLRALRQEAKLTLTDVADASGITAAQLSQIELGKTATSTWTLARICGALKCPIDVVFSA